MNEKSADYFLSVYVKNCSCKNRKQAYVYVACADY